jgi:hypothetical protein
VFSGRWHCQLEFHCRIPSTPFLVTPTSGKVGRTSPEDVQGHSRADVAAGIVRDKPEVPDEPMADGAIGRVSALSGQATNLQFSAKDFTGGKLSLSVQTVL